MSIIQGNAHTSAGGGYQIERSLRFNSADSAYLNRTPASAGNRQIFTWSGWVKRSAIAQHVLFSAPDGSGYFRWEIDSGANQAEVIAYNGTSITCRYTTANLFRDPSAWYHFVFAIDTTQATSTNRVKIYVNGVSASVTQTTAITQNTNTPINSTVEHAIGRSANFGPYYFSGYMTEVNFIDGQALTPSSFGETDAQTGVWKPKAYSGTYGTNGFFLKFADNSGTTSTTLGKDSSSNGNNWTPNNFSVTAGSGNDSLVDSPTAYGTDTGVGGSVRGNYATFNPLVGTHSNTYSDGNLQLATSTANAAFSHQRATFGISSGKWYWEVTCQATNTAYYVIGLASDRLNPDTQHLGNGSSGDGYLYRNDNGNKGTGGTYTAYGNTFTTGDIIGVAYDADNGKLWFSKNGTYQNSGSPSGGTNEAFSSITGTYYPAVTDFDNNTSRNSTFIINFGQRAFAYTAPSGFKALVTTNLPTPTIGATSTTQANDYFNVVTYSGSSAEQNITGVGFQPDFVWIKSRSNAESHVLSDVVRGATGGSYYRLFSDATAAESANVDNSVLALNADGFRVSGGTAATNVGRSGYTYVSWNWKANGAGSSNTAGTITSTVSANTTSGFSIVTYTGTGSAATVGHGLGVAPSFVIVKFRTEVENWYCYHASIGNTKAILLNTAGAATGASANYWNNTTPTSSVVSLGGTTSAPYTYVMYAFAAVAGYSAFGSYVGNGSTDGPFIYTGFRPRWVMIKLSSAADEGWFIVDTARDTYNAMGTILIANTSGADNTSQYPFIDYVSNGFKLRKLWGGVNGNGSTFIYAAFAEFPFKYSLAR